MMTLRLIVTLFILSSFSKAALASKLCDRVALGCGLNLTEVRDVFLLPSSETWVLFRDLIVKKGGELHIDAGTMVLVSPNAGIFVEQGAKLFVAGTKNNPVEISGIDPGTGTFQSFKGIHVEGLAPEGEAIFSHTENYEMGTDPDDSSGDIRNVVINNGGIGFDELSVVSALALSGVGSGTNLNNITINGCTNDCLSIFGGNFTMTDLEVDRAGDDLIDVKHKFTGELMTVSSQTGTFGMTDNNGKFVSSRKGSHFRSMTFETSSGTFDFKFQ